MAFVKLIFAICIGFNLFVIVELIKRGKASQLPVKVGISLLALWSLRFGLFYIKFELWIVNYPVLLVIDQYLFLLDGLFLWLYAKSVLKSFHFNFEIFLHFIPFVLFISLAMINAFRTPDQIVLKFNTSVAKVLGGESINEPFVLVFMILILSLSVFYFILSRREVKKYNYSLKANFSNIQNLHIDWLLKVQKLWLFLFIVPLAIYSFNYVSPVISMLIPGGIFILTLAFLSYYFATNLLSQSYAKDTIYKYEKKQEALEVTNEDKRELQNIFDKIRKNAYYEDEQLSLSQLADHLDKKPTELTELIKKSEYSNFYDLINSFRVEAVKKELQRTNEQVIVIAYQCGFNSKSTFNKIFKEYTGMTPKTYRNVYK